MPAPTPANVNGYRGKRLLDLAVSLSALVFLAPLMLLVAAMVRVGLGSPVIYLDRRVGLNDRVFALRKFRSMSNARDANGRLLPDGERLNAVGRFLRRWSLDELPQLLNVVRGEMSLVGPRPLPERYLPRYTEAERRRHAVRPGLTGWAQIHGRNSLSWERKFALDLWYVEHASLLTDLKVILLTLPRAFGAAEVAHLGCSEDHEFRGISPTARLPLAREERG